MWELEKAGYITRQQNRDGKGKMADMVYTIYEQPQPRPEAAEKEQPGLGNPVLENPTSDNPTSENPVSGNPMQLNKDIPSKEKSNTDLSSTQSIPIHSLTPSPAEGKAAQPPERKRKDANEAYRVYEEIIKDNISYDILKSDLPYDGDRLDEIVDCRATFYKCLRLKEKSR